MSGTTDRHAEPRGRSGPELLTLNLWGDNGLVRGLAVLGAVIVLDGRSGPIVSDHFGVRVRLALP